MTSFQFDPLGSRGTLGQWTAENGTVLKSKEALGSFNPTDAIERAYLADVYEHFGQSCVIIGWYPTDNPVPTAYLQFDDGFTLHAHVTDVWFD